MEPRTIPNIRGYKIIDFRGIFSILKGPIFFSIQSTCFCFHPFIPLFPSSTHYILLFALPCSFCVIVLLLQVFRQSFRTNSAVSRARASSALLFAQKFLRSYIQFIHIIFSANIYFRWVCCCSTQYFRIFVIFCLATLLPNNFIACLYVCRPLFPTSIVFELLHPLKNVCLSIFSQFFLYLPASAVTRLLYIWFCFFLI